MKRIKAVGQELLSQLKSKTILTRKPSLTLCSNHKKTVIGGGRIWNPLTMGQAFRDGKGWYIGHGNKKAVT